MGHHRVQAVATTIVIAHRGASGYLPEHTREAKALAYGQGADYLEQDVVATRDGALVVLHDIQLDYVTDVALHFPERRRSDGHFYVVDFDLAELRTLSLLERRRTDRDEPLFPRRFPRKPLGFRIVTLEEELELVQGLNRSTGRRVGVYPEIKHPRWHAEHGIDLSRRLLETLASFGFTQRDDPVFVQCFDGAEIVRLRRELRTELRLIRLVDAPDADPQLSSAKGLAALARDADGLGTPFGSLVTDDGGSAPPREGELVGRAREAGLLLHPYTFRRENVPAWAGDLEQLLAFYIGRIGVDGVFCDFPDVAVRIRDAVAARR
ncbi:MAG TPA: glycerophosphodiester phosphodiesterase [Gammaproteobacteria bacterium]